MDADHALRTTRSVRKRLDFDRSIDSGVIRECLEIALQAPSASNSQGWQFIVITEPDKIAAIAAAYRKAFELAVAAAAAAPAEYAAGDPRGEQWPRVLDSATYLAENMQRVPAMLIGCVEGRVENGPAADQADAYGSIIPAAWSFMIAARVRGIGMAWTTFHLMHEREVAELLGIPPEMTQAVLLPMAYFTGEDFKPAKRLPLEQVTHWNTWGQRAP
jgi:nitroreductase